MNKKLNPFDAQIKESYESFEPPYDPASWDAMGKKLDGMAPSPVNYFLVIASGIAAAGLIFMTLMFSTGDGSTAEQSLLSETSQMDDASKGSASVPSESATSEAASHLMPEASETTSASGDTLEANGQEEPKTNAETADAEKMPATGERDNRSLKAAKHSDTPVGSKLLTPDAPEEQATASTPEAADPAKSGIREKTLPMDKVITSNSGTHKRDVHVSCAGITIQFEASQEYGDEAKYLWNFGDGFFSNEANPSHTFAKPGTFDVSLSVTSYATGQISSNVVQAMIEVLDAPKAKATIHPISPTEIEFRNASVGGDEIEWRQETDVLILNDRAKISFADNTQTQLDLVVLNESGCVDTLRHEISFRHYGESQVVEASAGLPFFPPLPDTESTLEAIHIFDAASGKKVDFAAGAEGWDYSQAKSNRDYYYLAVAKKNGEIEMHRGMVRVQ